MSSIMTHPEPLFMLLLLLQIQLVVVHSLLPLADIYSNQTAVPTAVPCLPDEASALLLLKRSFSTTNDTICDFRSWRAGTDCCRWEGVRCGDENGRVTSLDLGDCGLQSGRLDTALFKLTSLSSSFAGQVSTGIGRLTNLVSLDLSTGFEIVELLDDGFSWKIDSNSELRVEANFETLIANLSKLTELHLGFVSNNGTNWCNALAKSSPKLKVLSLPYCRLSGPICSSLSSLHSLSIIDLSYNHLYGPIPDFLTDFSNLSVLQLNRNNLEGWVSPAIFEHKKLVTINLYSNLEIFGHLPNFSTSSRLEKLIVGRTNFSGTIPTSISNLRSLKELGLGASGFSGELPSSIGNLKSLSVLEISGMVGSIPSWVANLTSLTTLQFAYCGLSGSVPSFIGDLKKLRKLVLCHCSFSGEIPPQILNLTQLQTLLLYSNNFIGTVKLTSFRKLPLLRFLDLSDNNLVVVDGEDNSSLVSFPKMDLLGLSGCNMSKFPNFLRHQDEIYRLDLSENQIHGAIPQWAWETWSHLLYLILENNEFTSVGYAPFLPVHIEILDLSNNMFEGAIPIPQGSASALHYSRNRFSSVPPNFSSHLTEVTVFEASANNFSGNIPSSFCGPTSIQLLDLSYNNFSGSIPSCLMENANGMQSLNLKENQLHGGFPDNMNKGCSFEALDFSGNWIEGQLPRSLVTCKNLEVLDVGNNQISDSFPCWMSTLHRLEVLVLRSNKFFGQVAQSLAEKSACAFSSATIIDLSSNNFSGPMPLDQWFKKLNSMVFRDSNTSLVMDHEVPNTEKTYGYTAAVTYKGHDTTFAKILRTLVFIDLSNNAFLGSIPEAIGELVLLHGLNISHNSLTGTIPSQLGRLNQLEALDLSSNELSGVIPQELASLDFLTVLNLSYNKLEGRIPESPHFLTFTESSFLGNDGLCGPALSKGCSNITTLDVVPSKKNSADIMLFLFAGLGFGVGFAVVIVVVWVLPIRKKSRKSALLYSNK